MNIALLVLALLPFAQDGGAPPQPAPKPAPQDPLAQLAPRKPVAGLAGFQSVSSIVFDVEPQNPHVLETTYVFPDRARWQFAARNAQPGERQLVYRCGPAIFSLDPLQTASQQIDDAPPHGEMYAANCWAMELRRALFQWPDGFAWSGAGATRVADSGCGRKLEARLGEDGRPTAMFLQGEEDKRETYRAITWREQDGRWWPATLELHIDGGRLWTEKVDSLDTKVRVLDLFFVPPDRRVQSLAGELKSVDMVASWRLRIALAEGADWAAAAAAWNAAVAKYTGPDAQGWKLAPGSWVELDHAGAPRAVLVGFTPSEGVPPHEGVSLVAEHSVLLIGASGAAVDFSAAVEALIVATPASAKAGTPYARFPGTPGSAGPVQIVLPLEAQL